MLILGKKNPSKIHGYLSAVCNISWACLFDRISFGKYPSKIHVYLSADSLKKNPFRIYIFFWKYLLKFLHLLTIIHKNSLKIASKKSFKIHSFVSFHKRSLKIHLYVSADSWKKIPSKIHGYLSVVCNISWASMFIWQ